MDPKRKINIIYFGFLFVALSFLHVYQIFLIDDGTALRRFFYAIYAIGQCFLEVGILALLGSFLVRKYPKSLSPVFVVCTFLLFIVHIVDFPLVRIMDWSIWYVLDWILEEKMENFLELLYASNISIKIWIVVGIVMVVLPIFGVVFYRLTESFAKKLPYQLSYPTTAFSLMAIILFLSLFDFKTGELAAPHNESRYLKALPWKSTLSMQGYPMLKLKNGLKAQPSQTTFEAKLNSTNLNLAERPNIFLFVIESLRADFITDKTAPHMTAFRKKYSSFPLALSGANATPNSWYSIFHSRYSFYWDQNTEMGSPALSVLKKAGYKIHVYTAARLNYYKMDEVLFGKKQALLNSMDVFSHDEESWIGDQQCVEKLMDDMDRFRKEEGHVFIVFFDSTHFDYSWPKLDPVQFTPIVDNINYLKVAFLKENIEGIKNRYRNAIYFVDQLFGRFYNQLMKMPYARESVVAVTGDHGEEFFEKGHIFHMSSLSAMQTQVPIYLKLGDDSKSCQGEMICHTDIFPTVIDYVLKGDDFADFFDGESLLRDRQRPFALTVKYNGSRAPYEFALNNGKTKLVARFNNQRNIFNANSIEILERESRKNETLEFNEEMINREFATAFDYLFPAEKNSKSSR